MMLRRLGATQPISNSDAKKMTQKSRERLRISMRFSMLLPYIVRDGQTAVDSKVRSNLGIRWYDGIVSTQITNSAGQRLTHAPNESAPPSGTHRRSRRLHLAGVWILSFFDVLSFILLAVSPSRLQWTQSAETS